MTDDLWVQRRVNELKIGFIFLTRLPLTLQQPADLRANCRARFGARPSSAWPLGWSARPSTDWRKPCIFRRCPRRCLRSRRLSLVTGALHEDGLADVADGFGGGATRERKLDIMRDSRIGTYGVCALILSFMLRVAALSQVSAIPAWWPPRWSRLTPRRARRFAAFMRLVPAARADGMSADAGRPPQTSALVAALLGLIAVVMAASGLAPASSRSCLLCAGFGFMAWLCNRQIGGQTGDVLGALEQIGEIAVLLVAAAAVKRSAKFFRSR